MKTIKQVKKEYNQYSKLINAVLKNLDYEEIKEINNHGITGGFGKFIYYSDTVNFWKKNKNEIKKLAENIYYEIGYKNISEMLLSFNCFKNYDHEDKENILKAWYGNFNEDFFQIYNYFTWFAAEEVCRWFED